MEKSLSEIQNQSQNKIEEIPVKRGRGRPKKVDQVQKAAIAQETKTSGLKLTLKSLFDFLGKSLSVSLEHKEMELSEPEGELLADQADQLIIEFAPDIGNKWAKLAVFITSLITIFGKRFLSLEKKKKDAHVLKTTNSPELNKIVKINNGV